MILKFWKLHCQFLDKVVKLIDMLTEIVFVEKILQLFKILFELLSGKRIK